MISSPGCGRGRVPSRTARSRAGVQRRGSHPHPLLPPGYHPGSIRASRSIGFRELRFTYPDARGTGADAPVYRLQLDLGSLVVDIDRWIDELLGDFLDDLPVSNIVFFTWRGEWTGMLQGPGDRDSRFAPTSTSGETGSSFPSRRLSMPGAWSSSRIHEARRRR